jgi:hypothetical protein
MNAFNVWLKSHDKNIEELDAALKKLTQMQVVRTLYFYLENIYPGEKSDLEIVNFLIKRGGLIEYKDIIYNKRPIDLVIANKDIEAFTLFMKTLEEQKEYDIMRDYLVLALDYFSEYADSEIYELLKFFKYKYTFLGEPFTSSEHNIKGKSVLDVISKMFPVHSREYGAIYDGLKYDLDDEIVKECIRKISEELKISSSEIKKVLINQIS